MDQSPFDDNGFANVSLDDREAGLHCDPCNRDGETVEATWFCVDCDDYLCDGCRKAHRKIKTIQSHVVVDKAEARAHAGTGSRAGAEVPEVSTTIAEPEGEAMPCPTCSKHEGQPDHYYCAKCHVFCCIYCVSASHLSHDTVRMPDLSAHLSGPMDMAKMKEDVDKLAESVKSVRDGMKHNIDEIETHHEKVAEIFKDNIGVVTLLLKALTTDVSNTAEKVHETCVDQCDNIIARCEKTGTKIESIKDELKSDRFSTAFQRLNKMEKVNEILQIIGGTHGGEERQSHKETMASFKQIFEFIKVLRNLSSGSEDLWEIPQEDLPGFSTRTDEDDNEPVITGAVIAGNRAILADRANMVVKILDVKKEEVLMFLPLSKLFKG